MRKYPYIAFYCLLLLAIAISGTYFAGKHAADRWWQRQRQAVAFEGPTWPNVIDGESNTIFNCSDCVIIGKEISITHGKDLAAVVCSEETNGTVIEGHYRFENEERTISLICSNVPEIRWYVKWQR